MDKSQNLYPEFRQDALSIIEDLNKYLVVHAPEFKAFITEGFRTASYQFSLWQKGRTKKPIGKQYIVTYKDGYVKKSNHQSSMAFDIGFIKNNKLSYDVSTDVWNYFGHLIRAKKRKWGGDWTSFKDKPHCEWDTADKESYKKAREWQKANGLK